jgi:hypothetical protein
MTIHNYVEMIKSRCEKDEDTGCWNWTRATHVQGYAFARHKGTMRTVQRIMAIELELFPNINFTTRIGTSCNNKLCCNPDHIITQTPTEVNNRRYDRLGTGATFEGREQEVLTEYLHMKANRIPRTINIMAEKYDCSPAILYRTFKRANESKEG